MNFAKFLRTPFLYRTPPVAASNTLLEEVANQMIGFYMKRNTELK